jgi:DNA-binding transcriptional MocR family regulator
LANDQVFTKAERIIVTSGAQQALEILAKMPFPNGREAVLVEQPSYNRDFWRERAYRGTMNRG